MMQIRATVIMVPTAAVDPSKKLSDITQKFGVQKYTKFSINCDYRVDARAIGKD
ncbi:MAG: hypothetical protein RLZZ301_1722 [Bacteroidota bacterium]|jgi:hypothetical protein